MKWLGLLLVLALLGGSWFLYQRTSEHLKDLGARAAMLEEAGDPDGDAGNIAGEIQALEGQKTFNGILIAIFGAAFLGVMFTVFILPNWVSRMTESVYGSGASLDDPVSSEAHSLLAQGDYQGAIKVFQQSAAAEPGNRLNWTEIAKIQRKNLELPEQAVATLDAALLSYDWAPEDRAYLLFRLAEIQDEDERKRDQAAATLRRVIADAPETRHAMNARNKLGEWGMS